MTKKFLLLVRHQQAASSHNPQLNLDKKKGAKASLFFYE